MRLWVNDPAWPLGRPTDMDGVTLTSLAEAAQCPVVILAVPVNGL